MSKKINPTMLVCEDCGSSDVETKMWVNPNTDELKDSCSDGESDDNYCNNCQSHPNLITYKEYQESKEE